MSPAGKVARERADGYRLDGRLNDSFQAVNLLLDKGVAVRRVTAADGFLRPATSSCPWPDAPRSPDGRQGRPAWTSPPRKPPDAGRRTTPKRLRIGMYQRYRGGNMDEGWTRWLFEQFGFPFTSSIDAEIQKGDLNAKYDVFILPDDSARRSPASRGGAGAGGGEGRGGEWRRERAGHHAAEYRSGIGARASRRSGTSSRRAGRW